MSKPEFKTPVRDWVEEHLALVILLCALILVLIILLLYLCYRHRNRSKLAYEKLELNLNEYWDERKHQNAGPTDEEREELAARYFLRSLPAVKIVGTCENIGSRRGKRYFMVKGDPTANISLGYRDQLFIFFPKPENCVFPTTERTASIYQGLLSKLRHPFVVPTITADIDTRYDLVYHLQPFYSQGSLKDMVYSTNPTYDYKRKYMVSGSKFSDVKISLYGRQILAGLNFFARLGFPYKKFIDSQCFC
eukprot:NODE_396_length_1549_cov_89.792546_g364_i0.p1 GENE.NODE_396_length_1549_cov_89.792546_g364_i0~~NODE_396_length_1549_cov_89.792546_g364_i0.p1  ORF type:complete len:249 (-),score=20.83 NODE_396_length_1549_cov_89.792546_g364_i0:730-1476(-)